MIEWINIFHVIFFLFILQQEKTHKNPIPPRTIFIFFMSHMFYFDSNKKKTHMYLFMCVNVFACGSLAFSYEKCTSLKYSHNKYYYNVFHLLLCMHTNERIMYERYIVITWVYLLDTIETPFRLLSSSDSSACCRGMFIMFDFLTFLLLWTIHSNIFFIIKNSCTSLCCYSIFFYCYLF